MGDIYAIIFVDRLLLLFYNRRTNTPQLIKYQKITVRRKCFDNEVRLVSAGRLPTLIKTGKIISANYRTEIQIFCQKAIGMEASQ